LSFASNDSEEKLDWMNEWSLSTAKIFFYLHTNTFNQISYNQREIICLEINR
jgi:hypothetical protein